MRDINVKHNYAIKDGQLWYSQNVLWIMLRLLCKCKRVMDVETMLCEMHETRFKLDLQICNSILTLYLAVEDFKNMGFILSIMNPFSQNKSAKNQCFLPTEAI